MYIEIRLSGSGGQGLITAGRILAEALTEEGNHVAQSQSYEPTSRGGLSRADLVASREGVDYPLVTALDRLLILDGVGAHASTPLLKPDALVLVDGDLVDDAPNGSFSTYALPFSATARALGNVRAANIVALGAMFAYGGLCGFDSLLNAIRGGTPKGFLDLNLEAAESGRCLAHAKITAARVPA